MLAAVVSVPLQETAKFEVVICEGNAATWLVGPLLPVPVVELGSRLTNRE